MGKWIDRLKQQKNPKTLTPHTAKTDETPSEEGFGSFGSTYPKRFRGKKAEQSAPPVADYPDCRGWKLAELQAWKRCLECEWAWWTRGVHACILQNDRRVDRAMITCTLEDADEQYTDAVAECESAAWEE